MHTNALALLRPCLEAIGIIELGICGHPNAEATLLKWEADNLTPGKLRAWFQDNIWPQYGSGLWSEPWSTFMREFAAAIQPYAYYSRSEPPLICRRPVCLRYAAMAGISIMA
jgi:hypothetical protein